MRARPFPWASLDVLRRDDIAAMRNLRRAIGQGDRLHDAAAVFEEAIGTAVSVRLHSIEATAASPDLDALAVVVERAGTVFVVEVERALAFELVARALRRPAPALSSGDAPAEAVSGALAALVMKALRRTNEPVRIVAAGRAIDVVREVGLADPMAAIFTLLVEVDAYRARVVFSRRAVAASAEPELRGADVALLADLRLRVPIVAARAWSTAQELRALRRGDVWIPGGLGARDRAWVASPRGTRGVAATLEGDGRLVIGETVEDLTMSDAAKDTLLESALDAPVVVRVEIGAVEMTAREWATLKPGDVVTTGTRVGGNVVLRAGGAELGRGELVEVEGEVGVRILAIAGG